MRTTERKRLANDKGLRAVFFNSLPEDDPEEHHDEADRGYRRVFVNSQSKLDSTQSSYDNYSKPE